MIGCGAIGSSLARMIHRDFSKAATIAYLADHHCERAHSLIKTLKLKASHTGIPELIEKSDLIIEAASGEVAAKVTPAVLQTAKQILVLSVGGLIQPGVWQKINRIKTGRLWVPSGAIAGIDGLCAAKEAGIQSVKLITRKPVAGLLGAPFFEKKKFPKLTGKKAVCVFKGTALSAIRAFPQNVNVAAVLSLASMGPKSTYVEVWTSKAYRKNTHEIEIEARSGTIRIEVQNIPSHLNPKTSALAVYAAAATLRNIFSNLKIGT